MAVSTSTEICSSERRLLHQLELSRRCGSVDVRDINSLSRVAFQRLSLVPKILGLCLNAELYIVPHLQMQTGTNPGWILAKVASVQLRCL